MVKGGLEGFGGLVAVGFASFASDGGDHIGGQTDVGSESIVERSYGTGFQGGLSGLLTENGIIGGVDAELFGGAGEEVGVMGEVCSIVIHRAFLTRGGGYIIMLLL